MVCKFCGSSELRTIDSRPSGRNSTRRRKMCLKCNNRFSTYEMTTEDFISINKEFRDGLKSVLLAHIGYAFDTPITDMEIHEKGEKKNVQQKKVSDA